MTQLDRDTIISEARTWAAAHCRITSNDDVARVRALLAIIEEDRQEIDRLHTEVGSRPDARTSRPGG